jgi:hypothetical protein
MITFPPLITTLTYVRDTITVNDAFLTELTTQIDEKNLAAGSTITIAARVITHAPGYVLRLTNYKLIVIADEYDAAGGSIDVSGTNGPNGAKGADGAKGYASATDANCKDGKPGATGGNGVPGTSGMQVQLFCKRLKAVKLLSCGGSGGNGGPGGKGGDGGNAVVVRTDPEGGKYNEYVGTAGGNGGKGGNASVGGAGGQITVRYIQRLGVLAPSATVTGGTGGTGGLGGAAGNVSGLLSHRLG